MLHFTPSHSLPTFPLYFASIMLPLFLLNSVKGQPIMVELKRGETLNGTLTNCDSWMNITMKDVVVSDAHGENFYKLKATYVKGIHIKYITMSNDLIDKFREEQLKEREYYRHRNNGGNNYQRRGNRRNYNGNQRYGGHSNRSQA